jgi:hypothetical protein
MAWFRLRPPSGAHRGAIMVSEDVLAAGQDLAW